MSLVSWWSLHGYRPQHRHVVRPMLILLAWSLSARIRRLLRPRSPGYQYSSSAPRQATYGMAGITASDYWPETLFTSRGTLCLRPLPRQYRWSRVKGQRGIEDVLNWSNYCFGCEPYLKIWSFPHYHFAFVTVIVGLVFLEPNIPSFNIWLNHLRTETIYLD